MKYIKNQRGVAMILELILVALVAGVLSVAGYRYYQAHYSKPAATSTSTTLPATTTIQPSYLTIPKYKIKITLSESIKDAYVYEGDSGSVSLSTHYFDSALAEGCKAQPHLPARFAEDFDGVAKLSFDIFEVTPDRSDSPENSSFRAYVTQGKAVRIGNNFYKIDKYDGCTSTDANVAAKILQIKQAFIDASKTIQKAN